MGLSDLRAELSQLDLVDQGPLLLLLQPLMAPASVKMNMMNNPSKALLMAPTPSATGTNPLMMIPLMMNSK